MIITNADSVTVKSGAMSDKNADRLRREWDAMSESAPLKRVDDIISTLSQDLWWAMHLDGIEMELWRMLDRRCNPRLYSQGAIEPKEARVLLDELRDLTVDPWPVAEPWWVRYDLPASALNHGVGPIIGYVVPAAQFESKHGPWRGR